MATTPSADHARLMGQLIAQTESNAEQIAALTAQVQEITKQIGVMAVNVATVTANLENERRLSEDLRTQLRVANQRDHDERETTIQQNFLQSLNGQSIAALIIASLVGALLSWVLMLAHH